MRSNKKIKGFTLIEIIMVIVLMGSLAGLLSGVIGQFSKIYSDTNIRNELTANARLAMERLSREIRRNVPFGIQIVGGSTIEFVTAKSGGRYIEPGYSHVSYAAGQPQPQCIFAHRFRAGATLTNLCLISVNDNTVTTLPFAVGDQLIIANSSAAQLQAGDSVATLTAVPTIALCTAQLPANSCPPIWPSVTFAAKTFPNASSTKHYLIADSTHEIGLIGTSIYWKKAANIDVTLFDGASDVTTADNILIENVASLAFTEDTAKGIITVTMTITKSGNSVQLYEEINIRNVP